MPPLRTLIVDDETLARSRLRRLLKPHAKHIEIVGEAASGDEAIHLAGELRAELLFLDIQMPGKNGFEVLPALDKTVQVIFVTAYDNFALKAFEVAAVDYLLKPVQRQRLADAIDRVSGHCSECGVARLLDFLQQSKSFLQRISVKSGHRIRFMDTAGIHCFRSDEKYTLAVDDGGTTIIDYTLAQLEAQLDPGQFRRVHRSCIINLDFLKEIHRLSPTRYVAILNNRVRTEVPVSRRYLPGLTGS